MYRISEDEMQAQQREYKSNYPAFVPFVLAEAQRRRIVSKYEVLLRTQNGMDTDDYCVLDNNKVEFYLGHVPPGSSALLLGTGTGREVIVAKEMGLRAVGTTFGSRNVFFGRHYLGLSDHELIECANEDLPFDAGTFDVVAGFQVFEHAIAPLLFLLESARVLRVGGELILEWPPASDYSMEDNPHHQICYCPGQAKALLEKAGFDHIRVFYSNGEDVPESEIWDCSNHGHMLCISGKRSTKSLTHVVNFMGI